MLGKIVGMIIINIAAILLFDFVCIAIGFMTDVIKKEDAEYVYAAIVISILFSILSVIISLILWGIWLISR